MCGQRKGPVALLPGKKLRYPLCGC